MENKAKLTREVMEAISLTTKQLPISEAMDTLPLPMTGFFASLTPEQQAAALSYRGPEDVGESKGVLIGAR